jgi:hypothetical protein
MRAWTVLFGAMALAFAASSAASQTPVAPPDVESIAYSEVTALWGAAASCGAPRCPMYSVIVNADGNARFEGRDTAVAAKGFKVSRATWRALVDRLAPYRPATSNVIEPGSPQCKDAPGLEVGRDPVTIVSWTAGGRTDRLLFNGECDYRASQDAVAALKAARQILFELLPLSQLVDGDRPAR